MVRRKSWKGASSLREKRGGQDRERTRRKKETKGRHLRWYWVTTFNPIKRRASSGARRYMV